MKAIIIIPARWGSSRFPGKPMEQFAGASLIEHTWRAARKTRLEVAIATDSEAILEHANGFGASVIMTGECNNGTERCAEAARLIGWEGAVVNWQGDSPMVPPQWIAALLDRLDGQECHIATPVQQCSDAQSRMLRADCLAGVPGGTTAALAIDFRALYFSKAVIPSRGPHWLHIGIYAYSALALTNYGREEGRLEKAEQLEQLRFIEKGLDIHCVPVEGPPIWEINNPGDVAIVERMMEERNGSVRA